MLLLCCSALYSSLAHTSRCLIPKYACMFLVAPPSNFALFVLSFSLGFSCHTHGSHSPIEIIHLLSTYYVLSVELDDTDVGENNRALGLVKYFLSSSSILLTSLSSTSTLIHQPSHTVPPLGLQFWLITPSVSYSPKLATLAFSLIAPFPITINQLSCPLDSTITLSLHNHPCLNPH